MCLKVLSLTLNLSLTSYGRSSSCAVRAAPVLGRSSIIAKSSSIATAATALRTALSKLSNVSTKDCGANFFCNFTRSGLPRSIRTTCSNDTFDTRLGKLGGGSALCCRTCMYLRNGICCGNRIGDLLAASTGITATSTTSISFTSTMLNKALASTATSTAYNIIVSASSSMRTIHTNLVIGDRRLGSDCSFIRRKLIPRARCCCTTCLGLNDNVICNRIGDFAAPTCSFSLSGSLISLKLSIG